MTKSKHPQHHLLPVLSLFVLVVGMVAIVFSSRAFSFTELTAIMIFYLFSNLLYGFQHKELSPTRVSEIVLVSLLVWYVSVLYLT